MEAEEPIHDYGRGKVDCGIDSFSRDEAREEREAHGQLQNVRKDPNGEGQLDATRRESV